MKRILLSILFIQSISGMSQIDPSSISAAQALKVYINNKKIFVEDENAAYSINPDRMNTELRKVIEHKALVQFIKNGGYLRINKDSEEKYNLAAKMRLKGGGPVLGWILYCGVKALAFAGFVGVAAGATTAVVAAAGPLAAPAVVVAGKVGAGALATGAVSTAGAALYATPVVGAAATQVVTASIATSGTVGFLGTVEAVALSAMAFGTSLPTP